MCCARKFSFANALQELAWVFTQPLPPPLKVPKRSELFELNLLGVVLEGYSATFRSMNETLSQQRTLKWVTAEQKLHCARNGVICLAEWDRRLVGLEFQADQNAIHTRRV